MKRIKKSRINKFFGYLLCISCFYNLSCKDFLDVVPDNTPTIDHAFKTRVEAERFLYGCFSFLPNFSNGGTNPAFFGGDEAWYIDPAQGTDPRLWYIARGSQGTQSPLADYWASQHTTYSLNGGKPIFTALSDCIIFLENIHKPYDLYDEERTRWIAEVKFLQAFYHFWLFRMYGPIPLIKENIPISTKGEAALRYREPVDEVVDYIVSLIDEAVEDLPLLIEDQINELGRPTQPIALAVKAQALTLAASPLFNGNEDYVGFTDDRGIPLFPETYDPKKWERAAEALKEAIESAHDAGHQLYDFRVMNPAQALTLNEKTILAMQVRGAATERWNEEIIWGDSNNSTINLQRACHPVFFVQQGGGGLYKSYAPTLQVVEQFYTKNGVPIEEDKDWEGIDPMQIRTATTADKYYIQPNYRTIQLHFDREPRFYGSIIFDGGTYYGNSRINDDNDMWVTPLLAGKIGGGASPSQRYPSTGYICKKWLHFRSSVPDNSNSFTQWRYAFPIIRLADLYLMYAEVLNETLAAPTDEVYYYIDLVRGRTGLKTVVDSWRDHSINPDKPLTQDGMREIIRRERMNELAFEGARFWDLKRWKLSKEYMNRPIRGLNIRGEIPADFYQETEIYPLKFETKDYLWPIRQSVLLSNRRLIQNPGWN